MYKTRDIRHLKQNMKHQGKHATFLDLTLFIDTFQLYHSLFPIFHGCIV